MIAIFGFPCVRNDDVAKATTYIYWNSETLATNKALPLLSESLLLLSLNGPTPKLSGPCDPLL